MLLSSFVVFFCTSGHLSIHFFSFPINPAPFSLLSHFCFHILESNPLCTTNRIKYSLCEDEKTKQRTNDCHYFSSPLKIMQIKLIVSPSFLPTTTSAATTTAATSTPSLRWSSQLLLLQPAFQVIFGRLLLGGRRGRLHRDSPVSGGGGAIIRGVEICHSSH